MPLRLKSLELHGYKTFATRSSFEFPGMITAIVGPNGSGKSNITDGLRWVLGEQSYGLLRGKKTEDMIFAGSEGRPRAGMATATIHFDNTEGWLPIDYSEVAITRRAYRDGQNEYLLNGQRVRLRDIGELLSQSGLSERNFTIIGQGLIDASLALRPEERRKLFEEAAGIGLYRSRREESLNRLEATHRNIERVQDIILELEPRITLLERQAQKALEYERIKADLKLSLREWYGYHWFKNQQDLVYQQESLKQQEKTVEAARYKYDTHNHQMVAIRQKVQELRQQLNGWHNQASAFHNEKELISREIAVIDERQRSLTDQSANLDVEKARLAQELESTRQALLELETEKDVLERELEGSSAKSAEIKSKLDDLVEQKNRHEAILADNRNRISRLENSLVQLNMQVEEKNNRKKNLNSSNDRLQAAIDESSQQVEALTKEQTKINREKEELDLEAQKISQNIDVIRKEVSATITQLSDLRSKKAKLQGEVSRITIEIDVIREAEKNLTGYSTGAKHLLTLIRKGDIQGLSNALSGELVIPEAYEAAITAALGEFMDAIIIQKEADVDQALVSLQGIQNARSTLFSAAAVESTTRPLASTHPGCVGNALDVIQYPDRIRPFLSVVLGQTIIVDTRQTAREVIRNLPEGARAVTLEGEIFYKSGVIIGGKQNASARISRPRQLHDLEIDLEKRKTDLSQIDDEILSIEANRKTLETKTQSLSHTSDEVQAQLRQVNSRLQQANLQAEKAKRQLDWNHTQQIQLETEELQIEKEINAAREKIKAGQAELSSVTEELQKTHSDSNFEEIDNLRSEYNYHLTSQAVNQRALNDLQKRIQEKREFIKNNEQNTTRHLDRTKQISENLKVLELNRAEKKSQEEEKTLALHDLQMSIDPAELELERLEANFNQMQELESSHQVALTNAEKHLTQAQMDLNHKRDNLEVLRRRVEEDFGLVAFEYSENQSGPTPLPIEGMVEELPRVEKLSPELEDSLSRQKAMLRRMGSVNPEAQAEYQTTKERYDFLKNQVADLFKAEDDLKKILQDLDALMKSEFLKTFEKVAAEFPKMFNRLFGGGGARLSLTEPENIHETGIDIHARLPGKREQELTLLSGGERSLTAVALIFALLKISPTPFCVLDEVDAALDETNVGRFRDLLVELSEEIQFILVTHNRNTVQAANVIYGITMGRDSTSQAISLRLDEVSEDMLGRA